MIDFELMNNEYLIQILNKKVIKNKKIAHNLKTNTLTRCT